MVAAAASRKRKRQRQRRARSGSVDSKGSSGRVDQEDIAQKLEQDKIVAPKREETILKSLSQLQVPEGNADLKHAGKKRKLEQRSLGVSNAAQVELTVEEQCAAWNVDGQIGVNLRSRLNIDRFFAVQVRAISKFMASSGDLCISAPTGSGKTLIFSVPIVASLMNRVVQRVRALVLLPTRELALQCRSVFDSLCAGTQLSVASSVGQTPFEQDQVAIRSCDILVCTPGRLVDHLKLTEEFTLEHLNFLVIDEADRLLGQRYQNWLQQIYEAAFQDRPGQAVWENGKLRLEATSARKQFGSSVASHRFDEPSIRRILCSATLTRNPEQLAALNLRRPIHVTLHAVVPKSTKEHGKAENISASASDGDTNVGKEESGAKASEESAETEVLQGFSLPETLTEHVIVCELREKPMALVQLLKSFDGQPTLVFASSVEATHRLAVFLKLYLGEGIAEISSSHNQKQRSKALAALGNGSISTVVVSDVMARGIDLDNLVNVINYDLPSRLPGYVHRVGRVARAGRDGNSYSILERKNTKPYKRMRAKLHHKDSILIKFDAEAAAEIGPAVTECLLKMKETVKAQAKAKRRLR